jgi:ligand-binding sensor domain-containing protein/signal transduction histidine kinase
MRKFGAFLFLFLACRAEQLPVKRYTKADGLAGNRVQCIFRDSHGFLWFGTTEGLSRFDGYQFTNFTSAQGLPSSNVNQIIETQSGVYWLATGAGPCRFDPARRGSSSRFTPSPLDRRAATALVEDRSGAIWCGTSSGLFRLPSGGAAFEPINIGMLLEPGNEDAIVSALLEDSQGVLWVGTGGALYRRAPDGRTRRYTVGNGLPTPFGFIEALLEDREGQIWIATRRGVWRTLPRPPLDRPPIAKVYGTHDGIQGAAWISSLLEASDGKLWAGGGGLNLFTAGQDSQGASFRAYTTAHGLSVGNVEALAEDRAGNLWAGTDGNGVMKITRNGFVRFTEHDGVSVHEFYSMFESRRGELCAVVGAGPRRIFAWFDGRRFVPVRPAFPASLTDPGWGIAQVALQDQAGEWWLATGQGLCRFPRTASAAGLANLRPKAIYTTRDGLSGNSIFRIFEDSRGDIWIGAIQQGEGLTCWDRATNKLHVIPELREAPTAFAEDRGGNVWVGSFHGSLGRIRQGRWSAIAGFGPGLTGMVSSIHLDRAGRLWVGTNGPGLFRFDDPDGLQPVAARYTTAEGLSSIRIAGITEDQQGRIWVSTAPGVDCLDLSTHGMPRIQHYSPADGLAEGEGTFAFCDRSGALWFATQHGVSRLVPDAQDPQPSPPVWVTGVRLGGVPYPVSDLGETQLRLPDLRPSQNQVEIEFGGLQFAAGETLRYQFGMEGGDLEWGPLAVGRSVNYAGLRPGRYRFRVRAINSAGVASAQPATVTFLILPPFWQRWWFMALLALGASGAIFALHRNRVARLLELERIRNRIATDLHDDIGASLSQIAVLSEVARVELARGDHLAEEPLVRIASVSRELVDSMIEIVWAVNPHNDRLRDLSQHMREFASDVFVARDIRLHFRAAETAQDARLGMDARRQVFLIFKECVHNIARHSGCTVVEVELKAEKDWLVVKVTDNGRGFNPAAVPSQLQGTHGHGLKSMHSRARNLGGWLEIQATENRGVTVILQVPLGRRRLRGEAYTPK